jgi:transcriptional regulator with XRE-family HTH domain
MDVPKTSLGTRLKTLRLEKDWSQGELAEQVGADGRQISRYENGHITPSADVLVKLAQVLDCSVDHLLLEDAPRRPLSIEDPDLATRLGDLNLLTKEDRTSVLHILDALLAKNRIKAFAQHIG